MTGENMKLESLAKKLQNICDENGLAYRFRRHEYPISLTISPLGGVAEQMAMLEMAEDKGYISPDARIVFEYKDGTLIYHLSETFTIGDALFSKVKNMFKNMLFLWLLQFNREVIQRQLLTPEQQKIIVGSEDSEPKEEEDDIPPDELIVNGGDQPADPMVRKAIKLVRSVGYADLSYLQAQLELDFAEANRILDSLEVLGIVGPHNGGEPREVLPYDSDAPDDDLSVDDDDLPDFSADEPNEGEASGDNADDAPPPDEQDPLVQQATEVVREVGSATVSLLQRRLSIGYSKASRLMETLERLGVVGPYNGSGPREVLPAVPTDAAAEEDDAE